MLDIVLVADALEAAIQPDLFQRRGNGQQYVAPGRATPAGRLRYFSPGFRFQFKRSHTEPWPQPFLMFSYSDVIFNRGRSVLLCPNSFR
jgi:hypothetical protein